MFSTGIRVDSELDIVDESFVARNKLEEYDYGLSTGPKGVFGALYCLQLTGRPYSDEN